MARLLGLPIRLQLDALNRRALVGGGSSSPIVLLNLAAQVLVVSMAEVVVCWALVGSTVETRLEAHGRLELRLALPLCDVTRRNWKRPRAR